MRTELPPAALRRRAEALAGGGRRLLGVTGPPGSGKSTLAAAVVRCLGDRAVLVPMDGFHRSDEELAALGLSEVKGAPSTFDAEGYLALLERLRAGAAASAPVFDRARERTVPDGLRVRAETPLVVTEGNYLLLDDGPWARVRGLLDECWYVDLPAVVRVPRLVARHVAHGKTPEQARAWVQRSDEANALLVAATRERADLVVPGA